MDNLRRDTQKNQEISMQQGPLPEAAQRASVRCWRCSVHIGAVKHHTAIIEPLGASSFLIAGRHLPIKSKHKSKHQYRRRLFPPCND